MSFRPLVSLAVALVLVLVTWSKPAFATVQVPLSDISYHECPAEVAAGTVSSGTSVAASCFIVTGKTTNKTGKPITNADIFGRIYDANGDSVMQNRTRLGSIDEVPPGEGTFELRITVPKNQPTPLQLKQFKAAGFVGAVRRLDYMQDE
ncbi:FxLYD domain-containing protein [Leptolyngbya sp. FACHB-261]|uniref:FxLYD domain-containing protein n=1 Tax=Leptolyngbya sp. FACHB-261 TaxID=2692806 RepID=UPI0016837F5A|nr:FxLYD domain-containing protein [Leptolyngbya sp. FACHB-261]MBD2100588.1 hypothetical protein [Leptolyngbya sp. FACHB-261]